MDKDLYVRMTDEEYEAFKQMKPLENYAPTELASALLTSIKRNDGVTRESFEVTSNRPVTEARITQGQYVITLTVTH